MHFLSMIFVTVTFLSIEVFQSATTPGKKEQQIRGNYNISFNHKCRKDGDGTKGDDTKGDDTTEVYEGEIK